MEIHMIKVGMNKHVSIKKKKKDFSPSLPPILLLLYIIYNILILN